jgi:dTDP-glucose 4,6-dehydratase
MRLLVTGGCGFLGSHFIRAWLAERPDDTIDNVDLLTYAGSLDNLGEAANDPRHVHHRIDVADPAALAAIWGASFDLIVHFAAETHVDRSLDAPALFVRTNVLGTQTVLAVARERGAGAIVVISTDEVYGPTPKGAVFGTGEPLHPTSPYAASKAAADWMALAYAHSFGMEVAIIRLVNVYGPRQYPEKLIPLFVSRALDRKPLPLYGHGRHKRHWLHVDDATAGIVAICRDGERRRERPVWHLGSGDEMENRAIAEQICVLCGADPALITHVADRPGHDPRYALDWSQTARVFGWRPRTDFQSGLAHTVRWYEEHRAAWREHTGWTPGFLRG